MWTPPSGATGAAPEVSRKRVRGVPKWAGGRHVDTATGAIGAASYGGRILVRDVPKRAGGAQERSKLLKMVSPKVPKEAPRACQEDPRKDPKRTKSFIFHVMFNTFRALAFSGFPLHDCPGDFQHRPRTVQEAPNSLEAPKTAQRDHERPKRRPRSPKKHPREPQEGPKRGNANRHFKPSTSRWPQLPPGGPRSATTRPQEVPKRPQDAPKRPHKKSRRAL